MDREVTACVTKKEFRNVIKRIKVSQEQEAQQQQFQARIIAELMLVHLVEIMESMKSPTSSPLFEIKFPVPSDTTFFSKRMLAILKKFPQVDFAKDRNLLNDPKLKDIFYDVFYTAFADCELEFCLDTKYNEKMTMSMDWSEVIEDY